VSITTHLGRFTRALRSTLAITLVAGSSCVVAQVPAKVTSAACQLSAVAPYSPYGYNVSKGVSATVDLSATGLDGFDLTIPTGGSSVAMVLAERPTAGSCNNNTWYTSTVSVSKSGSICGFVKYGGSSATLSNCITSGSHSPPGVSRTNRTAPLYLCMTAYNLTGCYGGPYVNRGF
jgi:hypothetical protein